MHDVAKDLCDPAKLMHNKGGFPCVGTQGALGRVGAPYILTSPLRQKGIPRICSPSQQLQNKKGHTSKHQACNQKTAVDKVLQRSLCVTTSSTNKKDAHHKLVCIPIA